MFIHRLHALSQMMSSRHGPGAYEGDGRDDGRGGRVSAIRCDLSKINHPDFKICWMTELIECMPIREWHVTRRLPNFCLTEKVDGA